MKQWVNLNLILALVVLLTFPIAAVGTRWGIWSYGHAFLALRVEFFLGLIVILMSVILFLTQLVGGYKGYLGAVILSFIFVLIAITPLIDQYYQVNKLPKIHDITTDWENPPQFQAALALRPAGSNSVEYQGEEIAAQQRAAYPDIQPIYTTLNPRQAFRVAEAAVSQLKWDIALVNENSGLLEANQTSLWFGFTDDIIIRVREVNVGVTRVDIRSVSRVGVSDIGVNADRVSKFMTAFNELSQGR